MAEIRIEGREVKMGKKDGNNIFDAGHLYLVYVDDDGKETIIGGGPSDNPLTNVNATLDVIIDFPIQLSQEKWDGKDIEVRRQKRGSITLDLGDRDPEEVWQEMLVAAKKIGDAKIDYDIRGPNSNTLIAAVLNHVGITNLKLLPPVERVDGSWVNAPYPGTRHETVTELMEKAELSPPQGQDNQQNPETGRDQQFPKRKQPSLSDKESFLDLRPRLPAGPIPAEQQKTRITRPEPHPDKTLDNPENIFLAEQESRARLQQALAQIQNPTNDLNMIRQNETGQNKPLSQPEQKPVSDPQRAEFFRRQREIQQKRKHMLDPNQPSLLNLAPPGSELARILEERKQKLAKEKRKSLRANTNNTAVA